MRFLIVIQSRLSSKRLPGKALKKINGIEILLHLIKRIQSSNKLKKKIIVATSTNVKDNKIKNFCKRHGVKFFRGNLNNVILRYIELIKKFQLDFVVRINGDSPLIDPRIIQKLISIYKLKKKYDLITNTMPRTFPIGQSVEVINAKSLENIYYKIKKKEDKEHVTKYFYDNYKKFKIHNHYNSGNVNSSKIRMVVDTKEDFFYIKKILINKKFNYNLSFKKIIPLMKINVYQSFF